jgi:exodeoxyribonuclease VII large subunit
VRAATPTAAAELAVPVREELLAILDTHGKRMKRIVRWRWGNSRDSLSGVLRLATQRDPFLFIRRREQALDESAGRLERALLNRLQFNRRRLAALDAILQRIAPHRFVFRTGRAVERIEHRLRLGIYLRAKRSAMRLAEFNSRLHRHPPSTRAMENKQKLNRAESALRVAIADRLKSSNGAIAATERLLHAVSHKSVMARGYSITRLRRGNKLLRSVNDARKGEHIVTQLIDGKIESQIVSGPEPTLFEEP